MMCRCGIYMAIFIWLPSITCTGVSKSQLSQLQLHWFWRRNKEKRISNFKIWKYLLEFPFTCFSEFNWGKLSFFYNRHCIYICDYEELPLNTLCYITGVQLNHVREQSVHKGATNLRPKRHNWAAITEKRRGQTVGEWRREGFIFGDDYEDFIFSYTLT